MSTPKKTDSRKNPGANLTSRFLNLVRNPEGAETKPAAGRQPASAQKPAAQPPAAPARASIAPPPVAAAPRSQPTPVSHGAPTTAANPSANAAPAPAAPAPAAPAPAAPAPAAQTAAAPAPAATTTTKAVTMDAGSQTTQEVQPAIDPGKDASVADQRRPTPSANLPRTAEQNAAGRSPKEIIDQMHADSEAIGEPVSLRLPITPAFADYLLTLNEDNRSIAPVKLEQYVEDMTTGRWKENGEGISISSNLKLNNGQHRSHAVKRSNTTQIMTVTVGVTRDSRGTNDIGKGKTPGDHLGMDGQTNARALAAIARMVVSYRDANRSGLGRGGTISTPRLKAEIAADSRIIDSTTYAVRNQKAIAPYATNTILGFMHHTLSAIDAPAAERFLEGVLTSAEGGVGINVDDPRYRAREKLRGMMKNNNPAERVEVLMRAWNMWRQNKKTMSVIQVRHQFPDLR